MRRMGQHEDKENDKRGKNQGAKDQGSASHGYDAQDVQQGGRPDNDQADRDFIYRNLWKEEGRVSHEQYGINGEIKESIEPGPPSFEKSPAYAKRMFHPLIITSCHGHQAVELQHGEDRRNIP